MKYQFITGEYNGFDKSVNFYVRNERYERDTIKIVGHKPRFYVNSGQPIPQHPGLDYAEDGSKSIYGEDLTKLIMLSPTDVGGKWGLRDKFAKHYEADINYILRIMIDSGLRSGFEIPEGRKTIHFSDLKPLNFFLLPLICFLDIEVQVPRGVRRPDPSEAKYPVIAFSAWDNKIQTYLTVIVDPQGEEKTISRSPSHIVVFVASELRLFFLLNDYFSKLQPDVVSGWYIEDFDITYLKNRGKRLKFPLHFSSSCIFDLLEAYRSIFKKSGNRLKDVVIDEGITKEVVSSEYHPEWYEKRDLDAFIGYNKADVEYCVKIDAKHNLIRFFWGLKNFLGLPDMSQIIWHGVGVDTLLLRKAHKRGLVLPSRPKWGASFDGEDDKAFEGALVIPPREGIYDNISVLDMSRYYPSIIIAFNITPETVKNGEIGLLPELCLDLIQERSKYEEDMNLLPPGCQEYESLKERRNFIKFVSEAVFGYPASSRSRIHSKTTSARIALEAREGLLFITKELTKLDYPPIYTDTDGLFIKSNIENGHKIAETVNERLKEYCANRGIPPILKIKYERHFSSVAFAPLRGGERGAEKHYGGWVDFEDEKPADYLHIKGFDTIKRTCSRWARPIQKEVIGLILKKDRDGVISLLKKSIEAIKTAPLEDVCPKITLNKRFEDYKTQTDYVRGALYANKNLGAGIEPGDLVKLLYVNRVPNKPSTDIISFLDSETIPKDVEIDWGKMINKNLREDLEPLLSLLNINWNILSGQKGLSEVFI